MSRRDAHSGQSGSPDMTWIPLMDYAMRKGISLSTLRRHIKANKVVYRVENGRYLLLDEGGEDLDEAGALHSTVQKLAVDLKKAQEEIAELKTLIALYEEKLPHQRFSN